MAKKSFSYLLPKPEKLSRLELQDLIIKRYQSMPCKSKAQCGMMGLIASGKIKKKSLSKAKAREFMRGVKVKSLPKKVKKK